MGVFFLKKALYSVNLTLTPPQNPCFMPALILYDPALITLIDFFSLACFLGIEFQSCEQRLSCTDYCTLTHIFATSARANVSDPNATTNEPDTAATSEPNTAATSEPNTAATSEPNTAATSEPNTAATSEPNTAATSEPNTAATTTLFKDPCNSNPCGTGSTCQARFEDEYVCLCLAGDSYNNDSNSCERSKAFPGNFQLPSEKYDVNMKDHTSEAFKNTAKKITDALEKAFERPPYSGSVVLKLLPIPSRMIVESRNDNGVTASVQINFLANSAITESEVKEKIEKEVTCETCSLNGGSFAATDLCANDVCDEVTTDCTSGNGTYECTCKDDYMQTNYSIRMCIACPFGKKLKDNECVICSFGYSGLNCSENWKLILVIVGSVLGGLLLIAIILLPVVATQKSNKSFKKNKSAEMEKPAINLSSASQPMVGNQLGHSQGASFNRSANGHSGVQNGGVPMFPRAANPTSSWDNPSNANFGHMNSGSRIYDEPYAQTRPQSNPYAQNQPRMNPYAQNQGHSNPHYTHDDGKRYY